MLPNLAVVFGGPSPEHDVSILTGLQAARELSRSHKVTALFWSKTGDWYVVPADLEGSAFLEGVPRDAEAIDLVAGPQGGFVRRKKGMFGKFTPIELDCAIVCCHGGPGEDGSLQAVLDLAEVPYAGPNVSGAALGMDKLAFGALVVAAGLPSLPRALLSESTSEIKFAGPYIVKPRFGGSSIGIEVVENLDTAKALLRTSPHFKAGAVVEPYRPDSVDLNVAVRLYPQPELSAIEKPTRASADNKILGYADKYVGGQGMVSAPRELPAQISQQHYDEVHRLAFAVAELVGVRGIQRIDFLLDGGNLYVNEINTIPGSLSKHLFVEPAVPFGTLLDDMIKEAIARKSHHFTAAGADGSALRSAGSIAGKLS